MITTCGKCGRPLKDPQSVERGYGPDCWAAVLAAAKEAAVEKQGPDESEEAQTA